MKLFLDSRGFIISFGFDMEQRKPDPHMIAWCDPATGEWGTLSTNQAGTVVQPFVVAPEFVHECNGRVIAYQPGRCIEMTYIGAPYVWVIRSLLPEKITTPMSSITSAA